MKSRISKSLVILIVSGLLLWSTGCSASQNTLSGSGSTPTEAPSKTNTLTNVVLVAGGIAIVAGGLIYLIPKISAASRFSDKSVNGIDISISNFLH